MADLTVTPANVKLVDGTAIPVRGTAGEALTAGECVYRSIAEGNKWMLLDVDDTAIMADISSAAQSIGIVLTGGAAISDPVIVCPYGNINPGATLTAKEAYYASDTAGGIKPQGDLGTGDVAVYLGTALSTSVLAMAPANHVEVLA
jgi:hypothetical protein